MTIVKRYKDFIIALGKDKRYHLFLKVEWAYGNGYRIEEHDTGDIAEAIEFINSY